MIKTLFYAVVAISSLISVLLSVIAIILSIRKNGKDDMTHKDFIRKESALNRITAVAIYFFVAVTILLLLASVLEVLGPLLTRR